MKSTRQVAELTGISIRTLQYYDEIDLLKPCKLTSGGYRLYDEGSLQKLQKILFFKELGFRLKEIKRILDNPDFDQIQAFRKQKELLLLKRNRIERLIQLLSRLEKGEQCMSFKEFDLSDYIESLESFKRNNLDNIRNHWGSVENFNIFIQKVKEDESDIAKLAIKQYGSVEKYTEAMRYNMEHFSEIINQQSDETKELLQLTDTLYSKLTSDMQKDVSCDEIQGIVREIVENAQKNATAVMDDTLWDMTIDSYSGDIIKAITDTKYGEGASVYIAQALRYYFHKH